jgi:aarF domain-containing kinase
LAESDVPVYHTVEGTSSHDLGSENAEKPSSPSKSATDTKGGNDSTASEPQSAPSSRRQSAVPSGQFSRVANFAGLGMGLAFGTISEIAKQTFRGTIRSAGGLKGLMLTEKNSERLTLALCRMRGAALKLGQILSIQDDHVLPKDSPLRAVIDRVREEAEHMPPSQLHRVLREELGSDWRSLLTSFDDVPIAAASIGQVWHVCTSESG